MSYTENMSQEWAHVASIPPQSLASGSTLLTSPAVDTSKYSRVLFVIKTGNNTSGNTTDFKVQASATSGGSYADVDATNCAIAQVVAATNVNTVSELEVRMEKLVATTPGKPYLKGLLTSGGGQASLVSVDVWGAVARFKPASLGNDAAVIQTVVY